MAQRRAGEITMKNMLSKITLIILAIFISGCTQSAPEVGPNVVFATTTPADNLAPQAVPTATPLPPVPATVTAVPTATAVAQAEPPTSRLQFAPGATSIQVNDTLSGNAIKRYLVQAIAEQWMVVQVTSTNDIAKLAIYGTDGGNPLLQVTSNVSSWQGFLPSSQDYVIEVISTNAQLEAIFNLSVTIPRRISFGPGESSAQISASLAGNQVHDYIIRAQANQEMEVFVSPPSGRVLLSISALPGGQQLLAATARATSWFGTLPASQDYLIRAIGNGGGNYTLDVIIDPLASIPVTPGEALPEIVQFGLGETSAVINGTLFPNGVDAYSLQALAGQTMIVNLISADGSARLRVDGATDGVNLVNGLQSGATTWQGKLPRDQAYLVKAIATNSTANITYRLEITIPEVIRFSPGAISAERQGTVRDGQAHTYILSASAGQVMEVHITPPYGNVWLEISGFAGGQLLQPLTGETSWSGPLPATQDYIIKAVGRGGGAYTIQVIIR